MGKQWLDPRDRRWSQSINARLVGEVTPVATATYTITGTDYRVVFSEVCTVTLPLAIDRLGAVSLTNESAGALTLNCAGTDTIKGDSSLIIAFQNSTAVLFPVSGGWIII